MNVDAFRSQWSDDTPWCAPHWRPVAVCYALGGDMDECKVDPDTLGGGVNASCTVPAKDSHDADQNPLAVPAPPPMAGL